MGEMATQKPDYGNWVSARLLYLPGGISVVLAGLSFLSVDQYGNFNAMLLMDKVEEDLRSDDIDSRAEAGMSRPGSRPWCWILWNGMEKGARSILAVAMDR